MRKIYQYLCSQLWNLIQATCGCARLEAIKSGYKDITGTWYLNVRRNAEARGFDFKLSHEYLQTLLETQDFKCKLSGLPIKIATCRSGKKYFKETTASLDRIDNNKGYEEGNVQILHKHVNYMKWKHDQDYFINLCQRITVNDKSNNEAKSKDR